MGDGAKNFVLESIGPLQPQPLRGQPAIGLHQCTGALCDPVFELGVGVLQLLVEDHVVECDRQPAAEDFDQRAVGIRQVALGLQQDHDLAAAAGANIKHRTVIDEFVLAPPEGGFDGLFEIGIERCLPRGSDEAAVTARSRQH